MLDGCSTYCDGSDDEKKPSYFPVVSIIYRVDMKPGVFSAERSNMRRSICCAVLLCGLSTSVSAQAPQPAVPVGTVVAAQMPITKTAEFVGRVQAIQRVEVNARITGYLEKVLFKEGDEINENQPLYEIEKALFQAAVDQAQGALEASKAKKQLTAIQYERAEQLMKTSAGTIVARDQALTADRAAAAQVLIDQANLDTAKINLGYTDIVSPISGKVGRTAITKGNVVSPQSGVLTTIVSQDPTYVLFPVSQRQIMRAREAGNSVDIIGIRSKLRFSDGSTYGPVGQIDFIDVTVDKATDTVQVRAVFPNTSGALIDGTLVTVSLEAGKPVEQVVVPQAALLTDQQGTYVLIVDDGKVAVRRIKTGGPSGEDMVISEGLSGGEQVIVEGLQVVRPGMTVQAKPAAPALPRG
jgi:membrane fusion protein (multidrug efflux system)